MRININETFESWVNRVSMFEKGHAMKRIAQGENAETVMEDMSNRITKKLMHPILKAIDQQIMSNFDSVQSNKEYQEKMKNVAKAADHVDMDS
jgi:glutamyl-tRNA reductase